MSKEKDTYTTEELAELFHTTPEELERRRQEAIEEGKRIREHEKKTQQEIEKQVIQNKKKKSKTQMKKELLEELKTEGIKHNLATQSLVYQVRKPSETNKKYTDEELQFGRDLLKDCINERKKLNKLLDELLEDNETQMTELFDLVGATEEEREQYLAELESESELSKDLYFDLFGKDIQGDYRFEGTPIEIIKSLIKELKIVNEKEILQMLDDESIEGKEKNKRLNEYLKGIEIEGNLFKLRQRNFDFKSVEPKKLVSLLDEQMKLNQRAIEGMQLASKINLELMNLSNQFSIFVIADNELIHSEATEKQTQLYIDISEEILNSMATYNSFTKLAKRKNPSRLFAETYLEEKEEENEALQKLKEEILKQEEEAQKGIRDSEELFDYVPIATKNKLITQEKVIPQLFVLGSKIKEKVSFDLVGDNNDNWIVSCIMEQYPIAFTTHTFKTLESLMTIQTTFEKEYASSIRRPFSTQDIIFLNKGGKVSKYTREEIIKTNREIMSIMSAIGKLDITDFVKKYNESRADDKKITEAEIKRISRIQNFAYMSGIEIEYNENGENQSNTLWYFVKENPIPIFDFVKLTNRYTMLPLEMDSYLIDTDLNQEITRVMKSIIASIRYYKTQKKKNPTPFQYHYFEGIEEGKNKKDIYNPQKALLLLKEKKLVGSWRYQITRKIDSIAEDCYFDDKRPIGKEKELTGKERTRFIDSIVEYLRKAKEDKNILDFVLYTDKEKTIKEETYITEGQQRKERIKKKQKGTFKEGQRKVTKRNPSIYKIAIIIE